MDRSLFRDIVHQLNNGETAFLKVEHNDKEYVRRFVPGDRLIILGCGHVSQALCKIASMLGFKIIAVDDRPSFANHQRFPDADTVICGDFVTTIEDLNIRQNDYVCVVTRGHKWDRECVEAVLSGEHMPYYIGMIGSHRRVSGLIDLLLEEGYPQDRVEALHAPVGLDIGAITVEEIAVSICAELIKCRRAEKRFAQAGELFQTNTNMVPLLYISQSDEPCAMLLVLDSTGSTPVKSGSIMAVGIDGRGYGTIGGGCGEAAAMTAARTVIGSGGYKMIELDMTNEVAADNGMVCGGRMTVLIEDIIG